MAYRTALLTMTFSEAEVTFAIIINLGAIVMNSALRVISLT